MQARLAVGFLLLVLTGCWWMPEPPGGEDAGEPSGDGSSIDAGPDATRIRADAGDGSAEPHDEPSDASPPEPVDAEASDVSEAEPHDDPPDLNRAAAAWFLEGSRFDMRQLCWDSCGAVGENDLRHFCWDSCGAVSDHDVRHLCWGSCGAISDHDLRQFCWGSCGSISDGDLRNLCWGTCGAIADSGLRNYCWGTCGAI
ncbi:MAG: hypothetical protein AAGF12_21640 [Myxococcota bacterium]